jgi:hypothetical protein
VVTTAAVKGTLKVPVLVPFPGIISPGSTAFALRATLRRTDFVAFLLTLPGLLLLLP